MAGTLLQGGRRRPRRARLSPLVGLAMMIVLASVLLLASPAGPSLQQRAQAPAGVAAGARRPAASRPSPPRFATILAPPSQRVRPGFARPPRSGLLFDLRTGRVLWRAHPRRVLPIASLTKMMTALLVARREPPGARVLITRQALAYQGSGVGVLPRGRRVRLETLLYGLLLPSGNDAAIALAQRVSGTVGRFVGLMNATASALGLRCTRFSSPHGFVDRGNHSCATDLAVLTREILRDRRLARIVGTRQAALPLPIPGGRLFLYNNNPLLLARYPGATGVKTGFTYAAGRCLVASARRGRVRLGVVLLRSPDPYGQARRLLDRGFRALHAPRPAAGRRRSPARRSR